MAKRELLLFFSASLTNLAWVVSFIFVSVHSIPGDILYQYQPYGLTLAVGWFTIILTGTSAGLLAVAIWPRKH